MSRSSPVAGRARSAAGRSAGAAQQRYQGSSAEHLWQRLNAMDFINRGMLFAAVLLLAFIPFMIVVESLAGRNTANGLVRRFGLDHRAASIVSHAFTSASSTSSALSGLSYVLFVLGGLAAAGALQELYESAFELESRGLKDTPRRLVWLGALIAGVAGSQEVGGWLRSHAGPVVLGIVALVAFTAFWWFTMWFLLAGRRSWKELFPSALATGLCWLGMTVAFSLFMSSQITGNYQKYGYVGVVLALMSYLIAIGVVVILGAVVGLVWRERHPKEVSAASQA